MFKAYKDFWIKGTQFKTKSTRSQYWWVVLCNILIYIIMVIPGVLLLAFGGTHMDINSGDSGIISIAVGMILIFAFIVYMFASMVPRYALMTRRFHDAGFSGWWIWLVIAYQVAMFLILMFMLVHAIGSINPLIGNANAMNTFKLHAHVIRLLNWIPAIFCFVIELLPSNTHKKAFLAKNRK